MTEPKLHDDATAARVQAAFERVWRERMTGLPFVNDRLRVELVGLRTWRGLRLGVLITPWFMNLLLLPVRAASPDGAAGGGDASAAWPRIGVGESAAFAFPAGRFDFIMGNEAGAGPYLACSLFSPMFEFADQHAARGTAEACLTALFDAASDAAAPDTPRAAAVVSKRDFLRGRWHGDADASVPSTEA